MFQIFLYINHITSLITLTTKAKIYGKNFDDNNHTNNNEFGKSSKLVYQK